MWRHFLNAVQTAWQISWKNPAQTTFPFLPLRCVLVSQENSFDLTTLGSVCVEQPLQSIKLRLRESPTSWMRDSRNRFVSSWQFRCFLGLITSKSAAIAFTGAFNANQWWKIKLGSFASMWKKHQSTDLESERNLRMKRERMVVSLQFAKLAVNVPNAHCYVYLYHRWWFLLLLAAKSSKINFFLDLFRLERGRLRNF